MNKQPCTWSEQDIIDFILRKLPADRFRQLETHLPECDVCRERHQEWLTMLQPAEEIAMPSPRLKRKLKRRFLLQKWFSHWRRPSFIIPAVSLAVIVLIMPVLKPFQPEPDRPLASFQNGEVLQDNMTLVMDPHTVQYEVMTLDTPEARGYVWVNPETGELLFLVKGINPPVEKDYQVWFITDDHRNIRANAGLLNTTNDMAHLYFRGTEVSRAVHIAVSLEPKGGSDYPTGPDTMFVPLTSPSR
ncbi:MAG: anti-sigma factor [Bacillaceae bacterium]|nr:anti-sigma factor [Bacillaceae bacterium]